MNLTEEYLNKCQGIIDRIKEQQNQIQKAAEWFAVSAACFAKQKLEFHHKVNHG